MPLPPIMAGTDYEAMREAPAMAKKFTVHTQTVGDDGETVVFFHGLFGQGKNFTRIAKGLQPTVPFGIGGFAESWGLGLDGVVQLHRAG